MYLFRMELLVLSLLAGGTAMAQEGTGAEEGRHEIALLVAHTHVGAGIEQVGRGRWLVLPAWGLNYNHWLNERWAVGLHTDLINENFVVEEFDEEVLERERPIAPALMAT
ncbi:MAG: hypothetical protein KDB96_15675, partial [Flavobacteriales bacterium]|nr:hypothetical protein [Flavobacteriales bacterium]